MYGLCAAVARATGMSERCLQYWMEITYGDPEPGQPIRRSPTEQVVLAVRALRAEGVEEVAAVAPVRELAHDLGYALRSLRDGEVGGSVASHLRAAIREEAEAVAEVSAALSDGQITPEELDAVRRERHEAEEAWRLLLRKLEATAAGGYVEDPD